MLRNIRWFFRRTKRVVEFLPIIWKGYDFDYKYGIDVFHYQLSRTADFLESKASLGVQAKQKARRLRTILEIMKKVYDEEYRMGHFTQMERIWGEMDMKWEDLNNGKSKFVGWKWKFAHTPEQQERAERQFSALARDAEKKHQRAKKLLWKLIDHNLEHMWD